MADYSDVTDWDYIFSTIGNAYFSGVTFDQLWDTVTITDNREDFDCAITALNDLNDLVAKDKTK